MSEYQFRFTFCDRCHPDKLPNVGILQENPVQGVCWGTFQEAMAEGWEETDYGHVCPQCAEEDRQETAEGDNMVLGREVWDDKLNWMYEEDEDEQDSNDEEGGPVDGGVSN